MSAEHPLDLVGRRPAAAAAPRRGRQARRRGGDRAPRSRAGLRRPAGADRCWRRDGRPRAGASRPADPSRSPRRRLVRSSAAGVAVAGVGRDEAPELAGPIEPDEDLAEQPLVAGRLAAGLEDLDGGVGDGSGGLGRRERPAVDALRRREQATTRDEVRVAGAAGRVERRRCPGPRAGRRRTAPGGTNSTSRRSPRPRRRAAPRRGGSRRRRHRAPPRRGLRRRPIEEEDDPAVAGEVRRDRLERPPERGRLPAPRRADRAAEQRLEREQRRRLPAEQPSRSRCRRARAAPGSAAGRLAEDEPDPRAAAAAAELVVAFTVTPRASAGTPRVEPRTAPRRTTTFAIPSARLWRSSPKRALGRAERARPRAAGRSRGRGG